ncbi:MAG: YajQ family cyclic di-GMP-binding protein [Magnetococcales bacterium]|nr:YajQ family cyclic di-GMP-binding protein [Magnetococcales bacterium]
MPSFDIACETDLQEVDNAVNQTIKEMETRYDFKGSKSKLERDGSTITLTADDDYKREQVVDILKAKLARRQLDTRSLQYGKVEPASGNMVRQLITVRQGIDMDHCKQIVKLVKDAKLKVQAAIQGEQVRVTGKKRDDLQEAITLVRGAGLELPLQFINFRE